MVRYLFALLFVCALLPTAAEASYRSVQYHHQQYQPLQYRHPQYQFAARFTYRGSQWSGRQRALASQRYYGGYGHFGGACAIAAAKGGPCGCEAMKLAGLSDRRYWLVSNWRVFPSTSAHVGAAALWGNQHVEIVTAVNGDGTVNTAGSVGHSHVRIASLTFVDPHPGGGSIAAASVPTPSEHSETAAKTPARQSRYAARAVNRYRYASAFRGYTRRATFMRTTRRSAPQDEGWGATDAPGRSL